MSEIGSNATLSAATGDIETLDTVVKRIAIKPATIVKMRRIYSLFSDEMGDGIKEADMIAYFFEKSFEAFLKSGEIEKRIKSLTD